MKNNNTPLGVNNKPTNLVRFEALPSDEEPSVITEEYKKLIIPASWLEEKEFEHYEINNRK